MRNNRKIEQHKEINNLLKQVEQLSKPDRCLLCGKKGIPFCNSHVVPQFILKKIAKDGMLLYGQSLNKKSEFIDTKTGIKNAFTFKLICRDCDKKEFANYEDPSFIYDYEKFSIVKQKMTLIEIAIKSHLSHIYTKLNMYNLGRKIYPNEMNILKSMDLKTSWEIDIEEHFSYIDKLNKYKKKNVFPFEIIYNDLLDYKIGIATQTILAYIYDMDGNKYFDPKDMISSYKVPYFYLVLFPYKGATRVVFYIEKNNYKKVKKIIEEFQNLSNEEKLHFLFISLMMYDEQFYLNPDLHDIINRDIKLRKLYRSTDKLGKDSGVYREIKNFKKYENYLSEKYKY